MFSRDCGRPRLSPRTTLCAALLLPVTIAVVTAMLERASKSMPSRVERGDMGAGGVMSSRDSAVLVSQVWRNRVLL